MWQIRGWLLFAAVWSLIGLGAVTDHAGVRGFCERTVPFAMLYLTALSTAGCGGRVISFWCGPSRRPLEFLGLSSALGWALLSLLLCLLASIGQFSPAYFVPLSLASSLLFGMGIDGRRSGISVWSDVPWTRLWIVYGRQVTTRVASVLTLAVILVTVLWASNPVWDYDSEMYHLPNSAGLLQQHGLVVSRDEPLANLPGQAYLWFALGLAANAEAYPALLVCWAALLTSLLAASLASRYLCIRAALWTPPVFWSALIVHAVASTPRIEPLYSLLFLATVAWLLESVRSRRLEWPKVVFCGVCLGTAASIKAQGLYGWPIIGVWWAWLWISQRSFRTTNILVRVTCLFLIGFVVMSPWWVKNYRAFGNPIHPMFNRQVDRDGLRSANPHVPNPGSRPWYFLARETADLFLKPNTFTGPPGQWPHYLFLLMPLLLVVEATEFASEKERDHKRLEDRKSWRLPFVATVFFLSAGYYLLALTLSHELRHQFGMFSLASILVAHIISQVGLRWRMDVLLPGVVSLMLLFVVAFPGRATRVPVLLRYLFGAIDARTVRETLIPANFPRACDWCNERLPPDAVVLFCWESRVYRLHRKVIADPGGHAWTTLFRNRSTPNEVSDYLHQQQVSYVLVNEASLVYNVEKSGLVPRTLYEDFRRQRDILVPSVLEPVFEYPQNQTKSVVVYRVR